jgi:hypothetical protein
MIILVKEISQSKQSVCTALRLHRQTLDGGIFSFLSGPLPVLTEGVVLGYKIMHGPPKSKIGGSWDIVSIELGRSKSWQSWDTCFGRKFSEI